MKQQHSRTMQALFAHPLKHDLRVSDVEAMMLHLDAKVENLTDHRLKLQLKSGETMVLHTAQGNRHTFLDNDGILRLRHFLEEAGIIPEHPTPHHHRDRGDQSKRLLVHLDHRGARLWWMEGNSVEGTSIKPHGLWSSHQRLSHRHDRDVAGQRAPVDFHFLGELTAAILQADHALLISHGHGQSDIRQLLQKNLKQHHSGATVHLEMVTVNDTECSDAELIAIAREKFGNLPNRKPTKSPRSPRESLE